MSYCVLVVLMTQLDLQHVYLLYTVVARLTYAASAWRGLTRASDLQRINSGTCPAGLIYKPYHALLHLHICIFIFFDL